MCARIVVGILSLLVMPAPARAVHDSGAAYEVVGFSLTNQVFVRVSDVQRGVQRFELYNLKGELQGVRDLDAGEDAVEVESQLAVKYGIVSVGYAGPVSPDRRAALAIVPTTLSQKGPFEYEVHLSDGAGAQTAAVIPVPTDCRSAVITHAQTTVVWSPDASTVVIAGGIHVESPCGRPDLHPVLVFASPDVSANPNQLKSLARLLKQNLRNLSSTRPAEAAFVAGQWLGIMPGDARALLTLARTRALSNDHGGALAALWSLMRRRSGRSLVRSALTSQWIAPLRHRASYRVLAWELLGE